MDIASWKRILLYWTSNTGFFDHTYYNLEQTDIEEFFTKYSIHISYSTKDLVKFLRESYPEFEFHLDDDNHLSSSDYTYLYSLLLHYCCVKNPEKYFHQICENLPEQMQLSIASFFKSLLSKDLTKLNIRQAIADALPEYPIQFPSEGPATPRCKYIKESPPTPKTSLIEEKNKELNLLKATLETERYEKGLLEVQLKQNEEKINKLKQEHKKQLEKIQELRNELLYNDANSSTPVKNFGDEQAKKRLQKEIIKKEEEISDLKSNIDQLQEEKNLINEKLNYVQQQFIACLDQINENNEKINDLKEKIERKDETIDYLTNVKNDLELFISETRQYTRSTAINDMNSSAEYLDLSLTTQSSNSGGGGGGSIGSPENLGCSVVDVQFREKEKENHELREIINKMNSEISKLVKHIRELIIKYSNIFEICNENLIVDEEGDITETFNVFENYIEKLAKKYMNSSNESKLLREEINSVKVQNKEINEKMQTIEKSLKEYEIQINDITREKNILSQKYELDLCKESIQKDELMELINGLKIKCNDLELEKEIEKQEHNLKLNYFENQIEHYNQKLSTVESEKTKSDDKCQCLTTELQVSDSIIDELTLANNELKINIKDLKSDVEKLESDVDVKTHTIKLLASELSTNDENITKLTDIIKNLEIDKSNFEISVNKLKKEIEITKLEKEKIKQDFSEYRYQMEKNLEKIEFSNINMKKIMDKYQHDLKIMNNKAKLSTEKIRELEQDKENLNKKITEMSKEYEELLQSKLNDEKAFNNEIKLVLEKLEECEEYKIVEQNTSSVESNNELIKGVNQLKNYLIHFFDKNTNLENQIKNLRENTLKLENKNLEITQENDHLQLNLSENMNSTKVLKEKCKNLEQCLIKNKNEIDLLQSTIKTLEEQKRINEENIGKINSLNKNILDRNEKITQLQSSETRLKNEILKSRNKLMNFEEKIDDFVRKIDELLIAIGTNEKDIIASIKQNDELQSKYDSLKDEYNQYKMNTNKEQDNLNKRLEKLALQLGEAQAKIKHLSKEKEEYENKLKSLTEKFVELQKNHDDLILQKQHLKGENEILKEEINKIEESKLNFTKQFKDFENMANDLQKVKFENENLVRDIDKMFEIFQIEDKNNLNLLQVCESKVKKLNEIEKLELKLITIQDHNTELTDKISKLSLRIEILQKENYELKLDIQQLNENVIELKNEKEKLEIDNSDNLTNLQALQMRENNYKEQINHLEKLNEEKNETILKIENEIKLLTEEKHNHQEEFGKTQIIYNDETEEKDKLINDLKLKIEENQTQFEQEKQLSAKLQNDVDILRAKLIKNRQLLEEKENAWSLEQKKLNEQSELAESRIKENRLELEGKLEKMKLKMKTLYNDEVTKIKNKSEHEYEKLKHELELLKVQNESLHMQQRRYEINQQKYSKQIFELTEKNLDLQKQNTFLETRLKSFDSIKQQFHYQSAISLNSKKQQQSTKGLNSNLEMEDEEGEIFNNTYLADLKNGRMSPLFGRDSITINELKYRNSLAPPHLKSTYLAQYVDHDIPEDDIKDGLPFNFDDSSSSLLHTEQRKKLGGTSYKKPGPPTPSKNAGRLSIGGSGVNTSHMVNDYPREILKESNDNSKSNNNPNKFKMFSSNSKQTKDENIPPKRRLSSLFNRNKNK